MDAPVTIVEYTDFECPLCKRVHPTLLRLLEDHPEEVRLVFKHHPRSFPKEVSLAHRASLAAAKQGRFWEMHDKVFGDGRDYSRRKFMQYAKELGLDVRQFTSDMDSEETTRLVERDVLEARELGINSTPTFLINGRIVSGAQPYQNFEALIEREAARTGS